MGQLQGTLKGSSRPTNVYDDYLSRSNIGLSGGAASPRILHRRGRRTELLPGRRADSRRAVGIVGGGRQLEKELGVALFDRTRRQIALTATGEVFLEHAREVIHAAHRAQSSVADYRDQLTGSVTLGTLMSWGALNLPAALAAFRRHNPLVTVRLRQSLAGSAGHLEAIADGRMDLALVSITERPSPLIALRELT